MHGKTHAESLGRNIFVVRMRQLIIGGCGYLAIVDPSFHDALVVHLLQSGFHSEAVSKMKCQGFLSINKNFHWAVQNDTPRVKLKLHAKCILIFSRLKWFLKGHKSTWFVARAERLFLLSPTNHIHDEYDWLEKWKIIVLQVQHVRHAHNWSFNRQQRRLR